jgi:hypothetical protein
MIHNGNEEESKAMVRFIASKHLLFDGTVTNAEPSTWNFW